MNSELIDLHMHLLSGLDDGADDRTQALQMCRLSAADRVTTIVGTAHMFDGVFDVERIQLLRSIADLRDDLDAAGLPVRIQPAGETHIVPDLAERHVAGETVTVADAGRYLLVELPRDIIPPGAHQVLLEVQTEGVTPIITHPERNREIQRFPDLMRDFVEAGMLSQITAGSITGHFGDAAAECAGQLLTRNLAHVVASDAHSPLHRAPGLSKARRLAAEMVGTQRVDQMFLHWPHDILAARPIQPPQPREPERKKAWFLPFL
jgi:protein-tyrosine phosphatase